MSKKSLFSKITGLKKSKEKEDDQKKEVKTKKVKTKKEERNDSETEIESTPYADAEQNENWVEQNYEGQLSVDVYQTERDIVIKSAVAGVGSDDLDISISNDMITIRGNRTSDEKIDAENYFYQECYWGPFSRSIILPQEVEADKASADFKKGILTIRLPKAHQSQTIKIAINKN